MSEQPPTAPSSVLDALDNMFHPQLGSGQAGPSTATNSAFSSHTNPPSHLQSAHMATLQFHRTQEKKPMLSVGWDPIWSENVLTGATSSNEHDDIEMDQPRANSPYRGRPLITGAREFRIHYDMDSGIRSVDDGGDDQELKMVEYVTKGVNDHSHGLTVREARQRLGLQDRRDLLPAMEVRLLDHQCIGVAWMLDKEKSTERGGILADDMGLGKTIQMIATMSINLPAPEEENRTTLIVVPAALLQQWKDEIETKTNGLFKVCIHHGKDKLKKKSQIKEYDIIITSYQTLCVDFGVPEGMPAKEEAAWLEQNGGILARSRFYRVVADEAQFIRNRSTRASLSMAYVKTKYRWMLTGTPVTNSLADIYGLLRFGRFRPWNDWTAFNEHVAKVQLKDAPLAGQRAQAILLPVLLRRTKNSQLEGKPLLELPPKEIELVKLKFSPEEREIYESFEKNAKIRLNKFLKEESLNDNYSFVLVLMLRLRQLCGHPQLILSQSKQFDDPTLLNGTDSERELGRAVKAIGTSWVNQMKKQFLKRAREAQLFDPSEEAEGLDLNCPVCSEPYANDSARLLSCGHEICFDCSLELSNSPPVHSGIFGEGNDQENMAREKEFEAGVAKGHRPCPTCNKMVAMDANHSFKSSAFKPTNEELTLYIREERRRRRANQAAASPSSKARVGKSKLEESDDVDILKECKVEVKPETSAVHSSPLTRLQKFEEVKLDDSDDDELPGVDAMFSDLPKKRKRESEDEKPVVKDDPFKDDSDIEVVQATPSSSQSKKRKLPDFKKEKKPTDAGAGGKRKASSGSSPGSSSAPKASSSKTPTKKEEKLSDDLIATWTRNDDDLEPSSKMMALIKYLREWEATGDKTIVYSQWTSMLDLVESLFAKYGIRSLRLDGKMSMHAREGALANFREPRGPRVMLISIKCGNVGLNLVSANRIINLDLSWNYASESQAYDRCHRIGQDKTVIVKRLIVEDTIEERMLRLQDVKMGLADAALGEGGTTKLHRLSVRELKYLFGMTRQAPQPAGDDVHPFAGLPQ